MVYWGLKISCLFKTLIVKIVTHLICYVLALKNAVCNNSGFLCCSQRVKTDVTHEADHLW